ncbi:MAG: hypothetical protein PHG66_01565 [Candidatus Colwellbacteria bacterium]|nr:hypothetical protein [Candidatus Colwellbacteria bacterium]
MNGQQPEQNPVRPDFGQPQGGPAPASFNPQGMGFGSQAPSQSAWTPSAVPTPGPIAPAAPVAPVAPTPVNLAASPAPVAPQPTPVPAPAPTPAPAAPVTPPSVGGSGVVAPPPTGAQFEARTMKSDMESLKVTGGGEPVPQSFAPSSLDVGGNAFDPKAAATVKKGGKGAEKVIIWSAVTVGVIGAGILGYMLVKPLLTTTPAVTENPTVETGAPITPPPAAPESEVIPEVPVVAAHTSFFTLAADKTEEKLLTTLTAPDIKTAFISSPLDVPVDGSIREVVLKTAAGPIVFSDFISALFPGIPVDSARSAFVSDYTVFVYHSNATDLPGFIAKVDSAASPESLTAFSSALESSTVLGNLYPVDPGKLGAFKDGSINGKPVKYAAFAKAGYAFDYGWFKAADGSNYLVISSSYEGMKEAVKRAGF